MAAGSGAYECGHDMWTLVSNAHSTFLFSKKVLAFGSCVQIGMIKIGGSYEVHAHYEIN